MNAGENFGIARQFWVGLDELCDLRLDFGDLLGQAVIRRGIRTPFWG
jgi:hypothetical protein